MHILLSSIDNLKDRAVKILDIDDRRGRGHYLDDPDIIFKLSSQSLIVWKVGEYPNFLFVSFHFYFFFCDFVTVIDNSLSFTDCLPPDEEALAS